MTNRRRFFINGILLTAVGLAVRTVSLAFNAYVTKKIGAEGMGLFTLIGTVYAFAVTFATSGISLTVTRLVSSAIGEGREEEEGRILRAAVLYALIFSLFASFTLFFGAAYFGGTVLSDSRTVVCLRILSASLVPIALCSVFSGYFIGVKRVFKNAVIQVVAQIFKILITFFLIARFAHLGVEAATAALCLGMTLTEIAVFLSAFLQFLLDKKRVRAGKRDGRGRFHAVSSTALPLAASTYVRSALLTLEHALIPKRLRDSGQSHSAALSSYGILHGMALPMLLYPMSPLSSFSGLLVPEFSESLARGEKERLKRLASETLNTTLVYAIAAAVLLSLFSEEIGYAVYNSYEAGYYIAVMAPVLPIMYLDHVTDSMLKGVGEQVYSMWVNITDSFISIILVWVLIPRMGIMGYAVVRVVMEGYNFILSAVRLYSKIGFKVNAFRSVFLPLLSASLAVLLSKQIFIFDSSARPLWLILKIVFAVCVFLGTYTAANIKIKRKKRTTF